MLVCGLALTRAPGAARADEALTLEETVRLALTVNERALKAPLRVEAAAGQLERARAGFLPTLVAGGAGTLRPTDDRNTRALAGIGTLTLNQPLLNPSAFPLYAQARHQLASERWGATEDLRQLAYDAAHAFLVVLTTERLLDTAKRRLDRARQGQQDAQARAQAQLASSNDVTLSLVETAAAARDAAQAQGSVDRAYAQLAFIVGREVKGPLATPERTTRAAESGRFDRDEVVKESLLRRADVRSAEERTLALRASADEPLYRLAPTVSITGQARLTVDPLPPDKIHDESAQLTFSWTIYDAGVRYADRKTRLAQAESQSLDERQLRRSVATEIALAVASLRAAREAYRISGEAATAARQNTTEAETLYKQGLTRALEVVDANGRRYDAEVNLETARLAMEQAYLDLRFALGLDPLEGSAGASAKVPAETPAAPAPAAPAPAAPNAAASAPAVTTGAKDTGASVPAVTTGAKKGGKP